MGGSQKYGNAGWIAILGNLQDALPESIIGGDIYYNRDKRLPEAVGRIWYEADFDYDGGLRIGVCKMKQIILDFSDTKTLWQLHEYLKTSLALPEYYGRNMDALWDCLHCSFCEPTEIILENLDLCPDSLDEAIHSMTSLFYELESKNIEVTVKNISSEDNCYYLI